MYTAQQQSNPAEDSNGKNTSESNKSDKEDNVENVDYEVVDDDK